MLGIYITGVWKLHAGKVGNAARPKLRIAAKRVYKQLHVLGLSVVQ